MRDIPEWAALQGSTAAPDAARPLLRLFAGGAAMSRQLVAQPHPGPVHMLRCKTEVLGQMSAAVAPWQGCQQVAHTVPVRWTGMPDATAKEFSMSLATHLAELERKHRTLDTEIEKEQQHAHPDESRVTMLKRRKLLLKDEIVKVKDELVKKTIH
jgi:hypothetical protein